MGSFCFSVVLLMYPKMINMSNVIKLIKEKLFINSQSIDRRLSEQINLSNSRRIIKSRNSRCDEYGSFDRIN